MAQPVYPIQTKYPIQICVNKKKTYYYNLEILPGQKPHTSLIYIIDYLNDVKECGIIPNESVIVFTKALFIKIFGIKEYLDEYIAKSKLINRDHYHFNKIAIVDNEDKDSHIIAIYQEEK